MTEHAAYNVLALRHNGSYTGLQKLFDEFGSWAAAYEKSADRQTPEPMAAWRELERQRIRLILRQDPDFPALLKEIPWQPFALYVRGSLPKPQQLCVAIVGTRKATPAGLQIAHTIATDLARRGVAIISGLAFGVDVASHQGALQVGGTAIGVLASGVERITPRSNESLGRLVLEKGGAIISEYPIGTQSVPRLFLERNRIVSGLSRAVIVIEAPKRSGTLATARFAIEQNRELLVVPGAINNPNYEGSNELIKQGAQLITGSKDVLEALGIDEEKIKKPAELPFLDPTQKKIMLCLTERGEPVHTDALCAATGLSVELINEALAMLSITGLVKEDGGRYYVA